MTDHDLAVQMVRQGMEVFKEVNAETLAEVPNAVTISLLPVLLATCCQAVYNVAMMKQVAAAASNKAITLKDMDQSR